VIELSSGQDLSPKPIEETLPSLLVLTGAIGLQIHIAYRQKRRGGRSPQDFIRHDANGDARYDTAAYERHLKLMAQPLIREQIGRLLSAASLPDHSPTQEYSPVYELVLESSEHIQVSQGDIISVRGFRAGTNAPTTIELGSHYSGVPLISEYIKGR